MKIDDLMNEIKSKDYAAVINKFTPEFIVFKLGYIESMELAYLIFKSDLQNDEFQRFSLALMEKNKEIYPNEWGSDWKNDHFLAFLYDLNYEHQESYNSLISAYENSDHKNATLLLSIANCNSPPGFNFISFEYSLELAHESFKLKPSYDAALTLAGLYRTLGDKTNEAYWNAIYLDLEKKNISADTLTPDVFSRLAK